MTNWWRVCTPILRARFGAQLATANWFRPDQFHQTRQTHPAQIREPRSLTAAVGRRGWGAGGAGEDDRTARKGSHRIVRKGRQGRGARADRRRITLRGVSVLAVVERCADRGGLEVEPNSVRRDLGHEVAARVRRHAADLHTRSVVEPDQDAADTHASEVNNHTARQRRQSRRRRGRGRRTATGRSAARGASTAATSNERPCERKETYQHDVFQHITCFAKTDPARPWFAPTSMRTHVASTLEG